MTGGVAQRSNGRPGMAGIKALRHRIGRTGRTGRTGCAGCASRCLTLLGLVVIGAVAVGHAVPARAGSIDTSARQAILVDATTDTVLFEKNADQQMPTASMSKIMTMYMVFRALKQGRLTLNDTLPVSERAWRMGGSKMFVELNNRIRVEDLIRGVIVQSGNDASIVLAEGLAGSERAFAEDMNLVAAELGLEDSRFTNATGWPDPDHYSTARDLATLAMRLIERFPESYHYYAEKSFTYHGIKQGNRNPLLYRDMGADGLKTGHTEASGYGLTASVLRNGRRMILVVNGLPSMQARADESARLIEWGYREFNLYRLYGPQQPVDQAPVWLGETRTVPMVVPGGLAVTMSSVERDGLALKLVMEAPVPAPIERGARIGTLVMTAPGFVTREVPLVAGAAVDQLGLIGRIAAAAGHLLFGWL